MPEPLIRLLFLLHLASTLFMLGVIWFVQVVHYPLFARTGATEFPAYEKMHTSMTTWVVAPPMLLELATALLLLWIRPAGVSNLQSGIGLALLGMIWLSTMFLQVPAHNTLSMGFEAAVHQRLVSKNWIRTGAWSLRGLVVLWMAWLTFK
ncbi:hypothetical protein BH09PLA1_BH09PLA1_02430 [soil metagenome]